MLRGRGADRIEELSCRSSSRARIRVGDVIAEFGPIIAGLFLRQDLDSLRYCLLDLERNVRDLIARPRGYEYRAVPNELAR